MSGVQTRFSKRIFIKTVLAANGIAVTLSTLYGLYLYIPIWYSSLELTLQSWIMGTSLSFAGSNFFIVGILGIMGAFSEEITVKEASP